MTISRIELITRALRRIGAQTGAISSGTGTTAVLSGLIGTTGDDNAYKADRLMMLEAANETDKERLITTWADSTGTATFATRTDTTYTSENYILVPREDYTLLECRNALLKALRFTRRMYRQVIPLVPNLNIYPLSQCAWIEGAGDVLGAFVTYSPNMLHNEDMALWQNGASLAPDGWTLAGSGATVARSATGIRSNYAATVTRVTNDATLYQSLSPQLVQWLTRRQGVVFTPIQAGAWVVTSTAAVARVGIYNGSTTTWSSYASGTSGLPQWLSVSYTPTATDTDCRLVYSVDTTDAAATFHAGVLMQGSTLPQQLKDEGSQSYPELDSFMTRRNVGGWPAIELPAYPAQFGQLIVYTLRPFPDMTADTDVVDDQYGRVLVAGLVRFLVEASKPNQDRSRLDQVMKEEAAVWTREMTKLISLPVVPSPQQALVQGA